MSHLTVSFDDGLATMVIDRPPQNRIDDHMVDELARAVSAVESSDARAVLACSEGENFSFGGDIMTWPDASVRELRAGFGHYMPCSIASSICRCRSSSRCRACVSAAALNLRCART
jgi:enoyl-CoA hydratase/carnithine racemase